MYNLIMVIYVFMVALPLIVISRCLKLQSSKGITTLILILMCIFMNSCGSVVVATSLSAKGIEIGIRVEMLSRLVFMVCLVDFVYEYCHIKIPKIVRLITFMVIGVVTYGVLTLGLNNLFYEDIRMEKQLGLTVAKVEIGIFYKVYALYILGMIGLVIITLIKKIISNNNVEEKKQYIVIGVGVLIHLFGNIFNWKYSTYDYLPIFMSILSLCLYFAMTKYEVFELSVNAKEYSLDKMQEKFVVLDTNENVLYSNIHDFEDKENYISKLCSKFEGTLGKKQFTFEENGEFFESTRQEIRDKTGLVQGYLIEVKNITEKMKRLEQVQELKADAVLANNAKSVFLTHMSHEIRTPINAVLGMDEMIVRESTDETILEYADNIQTAGKALLSIINDILDFSKIASGELEIVNEKYQLEPVIKNAQRMVKPKIEGKDIELVMDINPKIPRGLFGDKNRIGQAMINILTNAAKYTEKGKITMKVDYEEKGAGINGVEILLKFAVKDTGCGIKEEDLKRLYTSFQRFDEERNRNIEGTGLGLTITKNLIKQMNGTMKVESVYGEGSTFSFEIPQIVIDFNGIGEQEKKEVKKSSKSKKYKESFHASDAKILVVDDNIINIKVFKGLLRNTGIQISSVLSGKECLEEVKKNSYDMIFMDHMMPEMDGIETLENLKKMEDSKCADIPVIALTANAMIGVREMYIEKGFTDYIMKPVDTEILEQMIIQYLPHELISLIE